MTTPDQNTLGQTPAGQTPSGDPGRSQGAWGAVARLLSVQLLTVIAVTAVITGIYALTGPHKNHQATVGSAAPAATTSTATTSKPAASTATAGTPSASTPSASTPSASPTASPTAPASPTVSQPPPVGAARLKVDVLNQSGPGGTAAKTATRVRALGWTVARVSDFRGNVSATTVYYPTGEAKAAHELSAALPGTPRVLPRFSTLADNRLTIIVTR
jgi:hypothetical protein